MFGVKLCKKNLRGVCYVHGFKTFGDAQMEMFKLKYASCTSSRFPESNRFLVLLDRPSSLIMTVLRKQNLLICANVHPKH